MNLKNIEWKVGQKEYVLCDYIYISFLEWAEPIYSDR